ncbi:MAG: tRNA (adenosine(37)-N6)-dimethylallyltransferase MiaA [Chloroflexi bacterium]|nr:tRNA (adenosine(37)-N6)-dimethylallyltransferase MiaA [Chloroflexota bacterium]
MLIPQQSSRIHRSSKPHLAVITGATAVGKSALALEVATRIGAEVVSADSRQVYQYMDIGTAKPTAAARAAVPHHLINVAYPNERYSVVEYRRTAERVLAQLRARGRASLVVGGSPHYIQALIDRLRPAPRSLALRAWLERVDRVDPGLLDAWLRALDAEASRQIDPRNRRRLLRAVEVVLLTGRPFSQTGRQRGPPVPAVWVGLRMDRAALYDRADRRIETMLSQGWIEEVRTLLAMGYDASLPAMSATGYAELARALRGDVAFEAAVERVRLATHAFIRRQEQWLRADDRVQWFDAEDPALVEQVVAACSELRHAGR